MSEGEGERQGQGFLEKPDGEEVGVERIKDLVREVLSEEARRDAVSGPVGAASAEEEKERVAEAVESTSTLEAKKTAAAQAVASADDGAEQEVIAEAVGMTSTLEAKKIAVATAVNTASSKNKKEIRHGSGGTALRHGTKRARPPVSPISRGGRQNMDNDR